MSILNTKGQECPEPDYIIMEPAYPKESPNMKRNGEVEICFKCSQGVDFYEDEFSRVSSSLAASSKPGYHPGSKETLQHKDEGKNKNPAVFSYKSVHPVTIAFIFMFMITGKLRIIHIQKLQLQRILLMSWKTPMIP